MTEPQIVKNESIQSYFAEIVHEAVEQRTVRITAEAQFYIVNMLCEFMLSDRLYTIEEDGRRDQEALALMRARAEEAEPVQRVRLLKRLGDSSLYISGFFAESLARSLVDVDYYISMGGSAYDSLSDLVRLRRSSKAPAVLYAELSSKFRPLVEVLAHVSETASAFSATNESILKLYDLWIRTGSNRVAEKLRACGLNPSTTVSEPSGEQ